MRYASGQAFRVALETRLRDQSVGTGVPLVRLRKTVAFDRLLARMFEAQPDAWLLKGGLALQLRLENRSRTTKDVDVLLRESGADAHEFLVAASLLDLGDWFAFEVARPSSIPGVGAARMSVSCRLDGRVFENFHIDVGFDDPVVGAAEVFQVTSLLRFADIDATIVPCYPLTQHIAEKLHALMAQRGSRENSRVKDLVDIVVIAEEFPVEADELIASVQATFAADPGSSLVDNPAVPASWVSEYRRMAVDLGLGTTELKPAEDLLREFIAPLFRRTTEEHWNPAIGSWE